MRREEKILMPKFRNMFIKLMYLIQIFEYLFFPLHFQEFSKRNFPSKSYMFVLRLCKYKFKCYHNAYYSKSKCNKNKITFLIVIFCVSTGCAKIVIVCLNHFIKMLTLLMQGGIYAPYYISAIFSRTTYPRRLQLYSKFKFCNCLIPKLGLVSKIFSYF